MSKFPASHDHLDNNIEYFWMHCLWPQPFNGKYFFLHWSDEWPYSILKHLSGDVYVLIMCAAHSSVYMRLVINGNGVIQFMNKEWPNPITPPSSISYKPAPQSTDRPDNSDHLVSIFSLGNGLFRVLLRYQPAQRIWFNSHAEDWVVRADRFPALFQANHVVEDFVNLLNIICEKDVSNY